MASRKVPQEQFLLEEVHSLGCGFRLALTAKHGPKSILQAVTRVGFKGVTMPFLEKLYTHLAIAERRPTKEANLVAKLLENIRPDATPDQVQAMLGCRTEETLEVVPSVLSSEALRNSQDAIDEDDREAMAREVDSGE